jgi:hypothetical protein
MAKAEFYEVVLKDKKDQVLVNSISLNDSIKKYLSSNSDIDNFCQKGNCAVLLDNFIETDTNNITFDFTKLTNKTVMSTLISEPSNSKDTFEELHKKILETTTYEENEKLEVEKVISLNNNEQLIPIFKKMSLEKFKLYKIILDFHLLDSEGLAMFENQIIKRLQTESIYFKIIEKFNNNATKKILIYQSSSDGLDSKYLEDYLNTHLLLTENFKVYFHKLYDADFMDLLQNGDLKSFVFSYNVENKNNLTDKNLFNPLYSIGDIFGNNITKVEIKPKKDEILDNKKLINFFEFATESGFLDTCELSKKGGGNKKINLMDKKLNIEYTESINVKNIYESVEFFERALEDKQDIVKKRLGL